MFRSLFTRRRGVALAVATVGLSTLSLAFVGTAGASSYSDNVGNASLLVGSGSQTSYSTMVALSTLFNASPGCDLTASTSTPAPPPAGAGAYGDLGCGTSSVTPGNPDGEQGFSVAAENPYNDYTVQAPPIGSGNGAGALEAEGSGTDPGPQIDYARASSHKGNLTTNDVAFAIDGVSWIAFNHVGSAGSTASATPVYTDKISSLSIGQVKAIWNGTVQCTIGTTTYFNNWMCLMSPLPSASHVAADSAPIDVYDAQTGSGTYSTWTGSGAADYSAGSNGLTTPGIICSTCEQGWVANGGSLSTIVSAHSNLFENQLSYIAQQPDAKDAIYFMSYGKFKTTCPAHTAANQQEAGANNYKSQAVCAGTVPSTATGAGKDWYATYGELVPSTGGSAITADATTIQNAVSGTSPVFPVTRDLYNDYSNSSATTNAASQATLNFVGEDGFLCKTSTAAQIDPQTGATYRSEIESTIQAQGFFPLDEGLTPISEGIGALSNAGAYTDAQYLANDVNDTFTLGSTSYVDTGATSGTGAGEGFCLVTVG